MRDLKRAQVFSFSVVSEHTYSVRSLTRQRSLIAASPKTLLHFISQRPAFGLQMLAQSTYILQSKLLKMALYFYFDYDTFCYTISMHIIVGLGNPGEEYVRSRHNTGRILLERFAKKEDIALASKGVQIGRAHV